MLSIQGGRAPAGVDAERKPSAVLRRVPDRRDSRSREELLQRVRAEFDEMPCLRLTLAQAAKLFGLRQDVCARVLRALVTENALWVGDDGRYAQRGR